MLNDQQYLQEKNIIVELEHQYGENVHIIQDAYLDSLLAKFCMNETMMPLMNQLCERLYRGLLVSVLQDLYPRRLQNITTRMSSFVNEAHFNGQFLDPGQKSVVVSLARAGIFPSHVCFEELNFLFEGKGLRQDHFYINRKTNERGEVVGVDVSGSKIGGDQDDSFVLFPDPMGATGGSLSYVVDYYKKSVPGTAKKYIAIHLIVTPEYLKRMKEDHPDVEVFALRLDRGLSSEKVLQSVPGTHWDEERGLTDNHYIVPGAGGVGEVLNNSYV